ncbi:50S ribosomal protein L35 [Oceanotoga sp. DSM 15011]|jgi:large subunit ribosomal protein L35|uniref:Large ribosomal subunit protein bL35 n=1 Tax=Oceanotoga teriensis TaxID=515440 RepID=A0AA45C4Z0_9BACT|nr:MULTISPECIES: 50S ribosomal protein L35 [Oceanotoga]MDN5342811.1 large subunit ribosomal protein [Oceanotoga sp.]MDO7977690.1 50S ribosomal protein L35 [Oceanotoga teriensis]PWJ87531.1 large subunit ribosomal protein L35 [Oceanotoga teriensis]UYO99645.1 50S ribosomal protein L35 [Oceanotoga sp. DSM 15011]
MAKIKIKTKSAAKKRYKVTGSGKVVRHRSHTGHNTGKKTNSKMRRLKRPVEINASFEKEAKRILGLR